MNTYLTQAISLSISAIVMGTAAASITIEKPPTIDRESALNPNYRTAQEIINNRGFDREAGQNDDSAGTRNGYLNNPTRPTIGSKPNDSIAAINCQHTAYKALCDEISGKIKDAIDGSGLNDQKGWVTLYNGTGTTTVHSPKEYVSYRLWYKYAANTVHPYSGRTTGYTTKTGYSSNIIGNGSVIKHGHSSTGGGKCGGDWTSVTAAASASLTIVPSITTRVPSQAYKSDHQYYRCASAFVEAQIKNFVITRFDAYY